MSAVEVGMPISMRTLCRVGSHVWITINEEKPHGDCDCGLMVWHEGDAEPKPAEVIVSEAPE